MGRLPDRCGTLARCAALYRERRRDGGSKPAHCVMARAARARSPLLTTAARSTGTDLLSKVPAVTLGFWVIKILATTLGETGGDTVTMTMNWGYLAGTALFL